MHTSSLVVVALSLDSWALGGTVGISLVVTGTLIDIKGGSKWTGKSLSWEESSSLGEGVTVVASEGRVVVSIALTSTGINCKQRKVKV